MSHDEYLSQLEVDSDASAAAVLAHVSACAVCRREQRRAERAIARLLPREGSRLEELARVAAVAALVAIAALGLRDPAARPSPSGEPARYRLVGDASGVIAYTPAGTLTAVSIAPGKEMPR